MFGQHSQRSFKRLRRPLLAEATKAYLAQPRSLCSGCLRKLGALHSSEVGVKLLTLEAVKAKLQTVKSKLLFEGRAGHGNFLTLPSECGPPAKSTSYVELEDEKHETTSEATVPPL